MVFAYGEISISNILDTSVLMITIYLLMILTLLIHVKYMVNIDF